jgi:hypothetical protein
LRAVPLLASGARHTLFGPDRRWSCHPAFQQCVSYVLPFFPQGQSAVDQGRCRWSGRPDKGLGGAREGRPTTDRPLPFPSACSSPPLAPPAPSLVSANASRPPSRLPFKTRLPTRSASSSSPRPVRRASPSPSCSWVRRPSLSSVSQRHHDVDSDDARLPLQATTTRCCIMARRLPSPTLARPAPMASSSSTSRRRRLSASARSARVTGTRPSPFTFGYPCCSISYVHSD